MNEPNVVWSMIDKDGDKIELIDQRNDAHPDSSGFVVTITRDHDDYASASVWVTQENLEALLVAFKTTARPQTLDEVEAFLNTPVLAPEDDPWQNVFEKDGPDSV